MDSVSEISDLRASETGTRRLRTLTEKGIEIFENSEKEFCSKLEATWHDIDFLLESVSAPSSEQALSNIHSEVTELYGKYCRLSTEYVDFLLQTNTRDSLKGVNSHKAMAEVLKGIVDRAHRQISNMKQQNLETSSRHSSVSRHSDHRSKANSVASGVSSILASKRAKAGAALARMKFVEEEASIVKRKAELDADSQYLSKKEKLQQQWLKLRPMNL